ncbi:MAG TPA: tetratricopeptide repeat protein [Tepidisphaeraceae bacterium]|jgi:hypothetical protein|nr:tetratricopeptide repeat protein [Tepidisphaeraceae bacterium]
MSNDTAMATVNTPDVPRLIRGRFVAYTGRLATMTHEQFVDVVGTYGGTYSNGVRLGIGTGLLVVGQRSIPIGSHGLPTDQLRRARIMKRRARAGLTVLNEEQFLGGLGLETQRDQVHPTLAAPTVCDLLGITRQRLQAWVRLGLVEPVTTLHGVWHFDFRRVSAANTLSEIVRSGVPIGRVRRSLRQLSRWLPDVASPLQQLAVLEATGDLAVRLEGGELATPDGQLQLDFDQEDPTTHAHEPEAFMRLRADEGPQTAAEWYQQGLERESGGYFEDAADSYRHALSVGGPDVDVCFDLANALHQLGRRPEAAERYRQVLELDRRRADAWNNLGVLLSELNEPLEAIAALRKSLEVDPDYGRAQYNLADALEEAGRPYDALPLWRSYAAADPFSQWGVYARERAQAPF